MRSYINKIFVGLFLITIFFIHLFFTNKVFADVPSIVYLKLNGEQQNLTFNPNNGESVNIEVKANEAVKFTRLYICHTSQVCNGSSGNYTRYFTQNDVIDTIILIAHKKHQ